LQARTLTFGQTPVLAHTAGLLFWCEGAFQAWSVGASSRVAQRARFSPASRAQSVADLPAVGNLTVEHFCLYLQGSWGFFVGRPAMFGCVAQQRAAWLLAVWFRAGLVAAALRGTTLATHTVVISAGLPLLEGGSL
jgi:hypothetical protein